MIGVVVVDVPPLKMAVKLVGYPAQYSTAYTTHNIPTPTMPCTMVLASYATYTHVWLVTIGLLVVPLANWNFATVTVRFNIGSTTII